MEFFILKPLVLGNLSLFSGMWNASEISRAILYTKLLSILCYYKYNDTNSHLVYHMCNTVQYIFPPASLCWATEPQILPCCLEDGKILNNKGKFSVKTQLHRHQRQTSVWYFLHGSIEAWRFVGSHYPLFLPISKLTQIYKNMQAHSTWDSWNH